LRGTRGLEFVRRTGFQAHKAAECDTRAADPGRSKREGEREGVEEWRAASDDEGDASRCCDINVAS
jgi:hypothetical protein